MKHIIAAALLAFALTPGMFAQVPLPGGSGAGGGGGGSSTATAVQAGLLAAIPATCTSGPTKVDLYYATDAATSTGLWRLYVCTATNTWTQTGIQGNVDGSITCISAAINQSDCQVTPGVFATLLGNNTFSGGTNSFAAATHTIPQQVIATDPVTCTVGESYTDTTTSPAINYDCLTTNVWTRRTPISASMTTAGSGGYWPFGYPQDQGVGPTLGSGTMYYCEFSSSVNITASQMAIFSATPGPAGSYGTFGIYDAAGARLSQTNNQDLTTVSASVTLFTFATPVTLVASTPYFMAVAANGIATWNFYTSTASIGPLIANATSVKRCFTDGQSVASPGTGQTMPATAALGSRSATGTLQAMHIFLTP